MLTLRARSRDCGVVVAVLSVSRMSAVDDPVTAVDSGKKSYEPDPKPVKKPKKDGKK